MKIFIERPVATAMFFLAVLVLGVYSFFNIPIELAPKEDFPRVTVLASWPGAPPEVIQTQVTSPLEEAAMAVKGVRKIFSESNIGYSRITLEFDDKANMEFAHLALREEMAKARRNLPYGVRPSVEPYVPEDFRVRPFLTYTISGNYSLQELRKMVREKIEFGIGSVKGVTRVDVEGGSDPEVKIILDRKKLKAYDIHPYEVNAAIADVLRTYPAGKIKKGSQEYLFKVSHSIQGINELDETIISHSGSNPIKLKDIAGITPTYGDVLSMERINGQPTIILRVLKEKGTNTLKAAREVKKKLDLLIKELPRDLTFKVVDDESLEVKKDLKDLYILGVIITLVNFVLIYIVLRTFIPSLLILSSIAFSVLITFNLIYVFRIPMNMLTLGGLALGFGIYVDNSIVVFENILRWREKGNPPFQSAASGSKEVFLPVLASTLTTISVFFCFPYFQGRLRIYYLPLAIVITSAMVASLLVSFSLIPALSPKLIKIKKKKIEAKEKSRGFYEKFLKLLIRHPLEAILVVLAIFYGSYRWFKAEVTIGEWYRWYSKERLYVRVGMPPGTGIDRTDAVVRKFEEKVLEASYEKEMSSTVRADDAYIIISFPPGIEASFRPYLLKEELIHLATQFAGISVSIYGFDPQGYYSSFETGTFYDSRIKFYGYNLKKLKEITSALEKTLKRNPRIKDVRITSSRYGWWRVDSLEHVLKVDREALKKYSIDPSYLYFHLATLIRGNFGAPARMRMEGKEAAISIKFPEADEMDLGSLLDSLIRTRGGEYLRLGEIVSLEERLIAGSIDRENQQYQQTVSWEFRGPAKASEKYRKTVFSNLRLPPGFSATLEETWRMTEEEKAQIQFTIIFSLIIIFMILASLYESFVDPFFIMLAVPLALIGVFVAFIIADYPFDPSAYIGVIILGGIVVNNSVLLVNHINLKRRQGFSLLEAIIVGAKERIRPIFMTTTTTIFGVLPMLFFQAETGKMHIWSSLALSTAGGLVSSTILIFIVIPIFYFYGDRIRLWAHEKLKEMRAAWRGF